MLGITVSGYHQSCGVALRHGSLQRLVSRLSVARKLVRRLIIDMCLS